jgi:hypothetical protein
MKKICFLSLILFTLAHFTTAQEQTTKIRDVLKEGPLITEPVFNDVADPDYLTGGDYLFRAGTRYMGGFVFSVLGTAIAATAALENEKEAMVAGYGVAAFGVFLTISGHVQLRKAGRAYNKEMVHLAPASEGIGLALKF